MKKIAFMSAFSIGALCLILLFNYQRDYEKKVSGGDMIPVLVAVKQISMGDILQRDMLATRQIPQSYIDNRHVRLTDLEKILGVRMTMGIRAEEALFWTDLAVENSKNRVLSQLISPGMRAITIALVSNHNLSAMLRPGDRIDVLYRASQAQGPIVMPLLQNIMILAVGQDIGNAQSNTTSVLRQTRKNSNLTLSVSVQQAQVLTLAQSEGSLSASLRHPDDIIVDKNSPVIGSEHIHLAEKRALLQSKSLPARGPTVPSLAKEIEHVR